MDFINNNNKNNNNYITSSNEIGNNSAQEIRKKYYICIPNPQPSIPNPHAIKYIFSIFK